MLYYRFLVLIAGRIWCFAPKREIFRRIDKWVLVLRILERDRRQA